MQPVAPPTSVQHPTGERVDDAHALPVRQYRVLDVPVEQLLRLHRVEHERRPRPGRVGRFLEEAVHPQSPLAVLVPPLVQYHVLVLHVDVVVHLRPEVVRQGVRGPVLVRRCRHLLRYDEGRPRLVDQHRIGLVHDAEAVERPAGQDRLRGTESEVIPEVVESQFGIGHVHDVARVRVAPLVLGHARLHEPDGQP